eukprot:UN07741
MLQSWHFDNAHFVGHSFGSIPIAWMVREQKAMVSGRTFIEPVCFLLLKPDIAYNFVYRKPRNWGQLLISWFGARELHIT